MVAAMLSLEADVEYEVTYRNLPELHTQREVSSKSRFQTEARYSRHGKRQGPVHAAHRRSARVN
jgi:hypothetical protein